MRNFPRVWYSQPYPTERQWPDLRGEVDRVFQDFWNFDPEWSRSQSREKEWSPACEVRNAEDHYLVSVDLPGIPKNQIKIEVADGQLRISGERSTEKKEDTEGRWYSERVHGKFERAFTFPKSVDAEKIEADYHEGVLHVYLPKAETIKPRQIKIGSENASGLFSRWLGKSGKEEKGERSQLDSSQPPTTAKRPIAS